MDSDTAKLARHFRIDDDVVVLRGSVAGLWTVTLFFGVGAALVALLGGALVLWGGHEVLQMMWRFLFWVSLTGAMLLSHGILTRESWRIEIDRKGARITAWRRGVEQPTSLTNDLEFAVGMAPRYPRSYYLIALLSTGRQVRLVHSFRRATIQSLLGELIAWIERRPPAEPVAPPVPP